MKTYALYRKIHDEQVDSIVLSQTILTTSQSEDYMKRILSDLEKKFSVAFLDKKVNSIYRHSDGFAVTYRAMRWYKILFYYREIDPNDVKMLDYLEGELNGVL